jgi:beta-carotene 3-hydroxylase
MTVLDRILIVTATVVAMEAFAWWAHKYVMHGWGWSWHRDHHEPHDGLLEKNDLFGLVFGAFSIGLFTFGFFYSLPLWWVAMGITVYGLIYAFVHDGLVHQRFMRWVPRKGYAKRLVQAHKLHHATVGKEGGVSFGFIIARDPATLKAELRAQAETKKAILREAI